MKFVLLIVALIGYGSPSQKIEPLLAREFASLTECEEAEKVVLQGLGTFSQNPANRVGTKCIEQKPEGYREADTTPAS